VTDVALFNLADPWTDRWQIIPWFGINFPGLLLMYPFEGKLEPGSQIMSCLFIGAIIFSAVVWSVVAGYVLRRKNVA
jgi:hypothetical protein